MKFFKEHADNILTQMPKHRLLALDVLRGLTITSMILVNNPGSWSYIYRPLKHAQWHGWTLTDLIFPFFLFIVGFALSISVSKQIADNVSRKDIVLNAFIRALKLFLLGWFLSIFYYRFGDANFSWLNDRLYMLRTMGVLQRIGLVYFISVILFIFCRPRTLFLCMILLLVVYSILMQFLPYTDLQGNSFQGLLIKGNNLSAWLDTSLLGSNHVYGKTQPFSYDPEGLLSSVPAVATCLSGILTGLYFQTTTKHSVRLLHQVFVLSVVGFISIGLGQLLSYWIPINKALWTASYVILSSGFACVSLAVCLYLVDIKNYRRWASPFVVFGANSIAFFMFAGITGRLLVMVPMGEVPVKTWLYDSFYQPIFGNLNGSLAFAISFLIVSYFVMHWMYRKQIFWKV